MPDTFPATKAETRADRPGEITAQTSDPDYSEAPDFVLLDASGPHPAALVLSFSCLSALVVLVVILASPLSPPCLPRAEIVSEIVVPRGPLWLPASPPALNSRASATPSSEPAKPVEPIEPKGESHPPSAPFQPRLAAKADAPAAVSSRLPLSVLPLPSSDVVSRALKLAPAATPGATHVEAGIARNQAPDALGTLPLRRLIEHQAALAATLAALPSEQRLALPRVSIRVNAEWLEALPQTQEKLYFSLTTPQADIEVLAYLPVTHRFGLERPLRPLWQIRDAERVPPLAALRSAAARRLGVPPEFVGLYTWHPPVLENALRMFVLERMEEMSVRLGPRDVVTVRLASGPSGCVMNLEPIRGGGSR